MARRVDGFVVHHNNNGNYFAWYSRDAPDIIIKERHCFPGTELLGKWVIMKLDENGRLNRTVTVRESLYQSRATRSFGEVKVEIEHTHTEGADEMFYHPVFGRIVDSAHMIERPRIGMFYDVWITGKKSNGAKWAVSNSNEPTVETGRRSGNQLPEFGHRNDTYRSSSFERDDRYQQRTFNAYSSENQRNWNTNESSAYHSALRSTSPSVQYRNDDSHDRRARGDDRHTTYDSSSRHQPSRSEYGYEGSRRSSRSPDSRVEYSARYEQDDRRSSNLNNYYQNESSSHRGSGSTRGSRNISPATYRSRVDDEQDINNQRYSSAENNSQSINRIDHRNFATGSSQKNVPERRPPSPPHSTSEVYSHTEPGTSMKPSRPPKETEMKVLKARLIQIQRLFGFFTNNESVALAMKLKGLEEYEDLEKILESIENI